VAARLAVAKAQVAAARRSVGRPKAEGSIVFDHVLVNSQVHGGA